MILAKITTIFRTVRHIQCQQIIWRGFYTIKRRFILDHTLNLRKEKHDKKKIKLYTSFLANSKSFQANNTFTFINLSLQIQKKIDWNYSKYGRLWTYNLNYFDFLMQTELDKATGLGFLNDYCINIGQVRVGLEPYPTALRCMNWIKFMVTHRIEDHTIEKYLWAQLRNLRKNLEFHLLGNHLLENGFALLMGAVFFNHEKLYRKARKLVVNELIEQVLDDGGHFELSPMYHQIILARLLDCINLIYSANAIGSEILPFLQKKASLMMGWLNVISFNDGNIPLLNDAAFRIAPETKDLIEYSQSLGIHPEKIKLKDSGYRKYVSKDSKYECVVDVGHVGPDYQPGHAHADTFSFELYYKGKPFIIDTGTSTYERGKRRSLERSTKAHNTVELFRSDSSEVWASHRVGRRAKVVVTEDSPNRISAWHNGYKNKGAIHWRSCIFNPDSIEIIDIITWQKNIKNKIARAYLHFSPGVSTDTKGKELFTENGVTIKFYGDVKPELFKYKYAPEFNKLIHAYAVKIEFPENLKTIISFENSLSY